MGWIRPDQIHFSKGTPTLIRTRLRLLGLSDGPNRSLPIPWQHERRPPQFSFLKPLPRGRAVDPNRPEGLRKSRRCPFVPVTVADSKARLAQRLWRRRITVGKP